MPNQDLWKIISQEAPPELQEHNALEQAYAIAAVINGSLTKEDIPYIIRTAKRIAINTLIDEDDLHGLNKNIAIGYRDLVNSDFVISKIVHWIGQIREELFDSAEPPFDNDLESAIKWVEETVKAETVDQKGSTAADSAGKMPDNISFLKSEIYLPYKNSVKAIWVQPGALLYHLGKRAINISQATGFRKHGVIVYILTGLEPIFSRVTLQINYGRAQLPFTGHKNDMPDTKPLTIASRSLSVNIHAPDLSPAELKNIYESYRRELKLNKMKSLSEEQVRLFYLVLNTGGPPKNGAKSFWLKIRDKWNSMPENKPYKSWEGVYQRYKIIEQKMHNMYFKK